MFSLSLSHHQIEAVMETICFNVIEKNSRVYIIINETKA